MIDNEKHVIIGVVKEITIAKLQNSTIPANGSTGKDVADFMQAIYDKVSGLYQGK